MLIKSVKGDFERWTAQYVLSDLLISDILEQSSIFHWGYLQGKRTDVNYRIWMHNYNIDSFVKVCKYFDNANAKNHFGNIIGVDLSNTKTRIELCKDKKGSWLEEHGDDPAKLFTMQVYLTDSKYSTSFGNEVTYATAGDGWFFANTGKEMHGLPELPEDRISIVVNYVNDNWIDQKVLIDKL